MPPITVWGRWGKIAGTEMLFLGGASSVDRRWRVRGHTWWPAENITTAQADQAIASATDPNQPPVDILVTHDTTTQVFNILAATSDHAAVRTGDTTDQTNPHHLTRVRDAASPRVHVHRHHHPRFAAPVDQAMTIALNAHPHDGSMAVLDTTDRRIVRTGITAVESYRLGLGTGGAADVYVSGEDLGQLINGYVLLSSSRGNLTVRVDDGRLSRAAARMIDGRLVCPGWSSGLIWPMTPTLGPAAPGRGGSPLWWPSEGGSGNRPETRELFRGS